MRTVGVVRGEVPQEPPEVVTESSENSKDPRLQVAADDFR